MPEQEVAMSVLGGPIKFWWDENWETPEHWHYDAWREAFSAGLVADGSFLAYRPHHAFKGRWTERAQAVNDAAIRACDVFFDMTPTFDTIPEGVTSDGTDSEKLQASSSGALVFPAAPPRDKADFDSEIQRIITDVKEMGVHRKMVEQKPVKECIAWHPDREWMFAGLAQRWSGRVIRLHHFGAETGFAVDDVPELLVDEAEGLAAFESRSRLQVVHLPQILKAEVLDQLAASTQATPK